MRPLAIFDLLLRLLVAGLFAYAGVLKIWDFSQHTWATPRFFEDILNYRLGSWDFTVAGVRVTAWDAFLGVALFLPWLEIVAAVALLSKFLRWGAAWLLTLLTVVFMAALTSAWMRDLDISCGCFGREEKGADIPVILARDGVLLAILVFICWHEWRRQWQASAIPVNASEASVV